MLRDGDKEATGRRFHTPPVFGRDKADRSLEISKLQIIIHG